MCDSCTISRSSCKRMRPLESSELHTRLRFGLKPTPLPGKVKRVGDRSVERRDFTDETSELKSYLDSHQRYEGRNGKALCWYHGVTNMPTKLGERSYSLSDENTEKMEMSKSCSKGESCEEDQEREEERTGGNSKESNGGGKADRKKCTVCGDKAFGCNFSAITCESCKAFFRRNALKTKKFVCPFTNDCKMDPVKRRFCQKCRLKKCFEVGMKKEWIMTNEEKILKKKKIEANKLKRSNDGKENGRSCHDDYSKRFKENDIGSTDYNIDAASKPANLENSNFRALGMQTNHSTDFIADGHSNIQSPQSPYVRPLSASSTMISGDSRSPEMFDKLEPYNVSQEKSWPHKNALVLVTTDASNGNLKTEIFNNLDSSPHIPAPTSTTDSCTQTSNPLLHELIAPNLESHKRMEATEVETGYCVYPEPYYNSGITHIPNHKNEEYQAFHFEIPMPDPPTFSAQDEMNGQDAAYDIALEPQDHFQTIVTTAINAEYNSYKKLNSDCAPISNELSKSEQEKLNELLIAGRALNEPVDAEAPNILDTADPSLINVINLTDVAIRRLIRMSKQIAAFKNMCQDDQVAMLKGGCTEMMILRSVVSYDSDRDSWNIPHSNFGYNIKLGVLKEAPGNLYEEHQRFVKSFQPKWRTDENIMAILCAITLFNPERQNIIHKDAVWLERNFYYYLLKRYLESILNGCEARSTYILLINKMTELRILNSTHLRVFMEVNPKEVEPLLIEIFDLKQ